MQEERMPQYVPVNATYPSIKGVALNAEHDSRRKVLQPILVSRQQATDSVAPCILFGFALRLSGVMYSCSCLLTQTQVQNLSMHHITSDAATGSQP